ncbi:transglycosylase SLT domain-containing protein [Bermanella sp. WJH001]|uniref:transglycosylase SLT domain-containing protein n=1 Tax=Bermanella sp. WJH001 TaxID=3048005 RepID=UPI0024BDDE95|nr:transglycosylase SLT domain-containing protein [Bermanella sp. WJH001]MDJ1537682.1 transglycosylase SLT domain-containing protein [Bermanella sp. WJH001]
MPAANSSAVQVIPKGYQKSQDNNDSQASDTHLTEQQLTSHFKQAMKAYRSELRAYWPDAEVSSKTRLVLYSDNFQKKSAIDFKANEIQITMPSIHTGKVLNYRQMQKNLNETLIELLGTNLETAISKDPINKKMESLSGIRYAHDLGELGRDLLLSELFKDERPSIKAIERMAKKLTKSAYIRYPAVASLNLSFAFNDRTTYIISLPEKRMRMKAKRYKSFIYEYAQNYNLPPSLIFSIIHAESSFNPLARSQIPAFGLMQIVPHSAGKDATHMLFNKSRVLSPSYLYNPRKNVQVGAAYLHILYYRYLRDIENPKSRLYCAIAAYNAGTSSVMRTLTGQSSISSSTNAINRMQPNDVLRKLVRQMPSSETRDYVNKVLSLQKSYGQL